MYDGNVNLDLARERRQCPFNVEELTNVLDGDADATQRRRELESSVLSDPELRDDGVCPDYFSYEQRYEHYLKKACALFSRVRQHRENGEDADKFIPLIGGSALGVALFPDGNPLTVHVGMFLPCLVGQGTLEQQGRFFAPAWDFRLLGTYAQTELGHGTFVRGLETTATYIPETEQFEMNSPTITSIKWWPGSLGTTANWAIVQAQLWTKGECHGVHPFVVQLREEESHKPLPGIRIGEIGSKYGLHCNDNGFLAFNKVRIPREHMLMRHAKVLPDGTYIRPKHSKLSYGTMVFVRVMIVAESTSQLKRACTIATRYSAVRRQSELEPGRPEPQVLDYQLQQWKLLPFIATCYALHFAAQSLFDDYSNINNDMEKGDLDALPELHALSCGLKAVASWESVRGATVCMQACGGHGYLSASNFPRILQHAMASSIYEGENTILMLQVARFLLKAHKKAHSRTTMKPATIPASAHSTSYLAQVAVAATRKGAGDSSAFGEPAIDALKIGDESQPIPLELLVSSLEHMAIGLIDEAAASVQSRESQGNSPEMSFNLTSVQLMRCAHAHVRLFLLRTFARQISEIKASPPLRQVMGQLAELFALHSILNVDGQDLLRTGALSTDAWPRLQRRYEQLLALLRPAAVGLVDAFDLRDEMLGSALGASDGQVYQRLLKMAQMSPLNKSNVTNGAQKHILPFVNSKL